MSDAMSKGKKEMHRELTERERFLYFKDHRISSELFRFLQPLTSEKGEYMLAKYIYTFYHPSAPISTGGVNLAKRAEREENKKRREASPEDERSWPYLKEWIVQYLEPIKHGKARWERGIRTIENSFSEDDESDDDEDDDDEGDADSGPDRDASGGSNRNDGNDEVGGSGGGAIGVQ